MKGYNYFSIIVKTETGQSMDVMKQITYSELNNYILRLPSFSFENAIIINFHNENVLDIESILNKVKNIQWCKEGGCLPTCQNKVISRLDKEGNRHYIAKYGSCRSNKARIMTRGRNILDLTLSFLEFITQSIRTSFISHTT
jgi:hypothetical protein